MPFWKKTPCTADQLKKKMALDYDIRSNRLIFYRLNEYLAKMYWKAFAAASCSTVKQFQLKTELLTQLNVILEKTFNEKRQIKLMNKLYIYYIEGRALVLSTETMNLLKDARRNDDAIYTRAWNDAKTEILNDENFIKCYNDFKGKSAEEGGFFEVNKKIIESSLRSTAAKNKKKFSCEASTFAGYVNYGDYQYDAMYSHSFPFQDYTPYNPVIRGPSNDILAEPSSMLLALMVLIMVGIIILVICCISSMWAWIACYFLSEKRKQSTDTLRCFDIESLRNH